MAKIKFYPPDLRCNVNDKIWFRFSIDDSASVVFKIYDTLGSLVETLNAGTLEAGDYTSRQKAILWDRKDSGGSRVSAATYTVVAEIDGGSQTGTRTILLN